VNNMDNVFVVVYVDYGIEVLEVFKNRALAECYIGNFPHDDNYNVKNFHILEKKLWEK